MVTQCVPLLVLIMIGINTMENKFEFFIGMFVGAFVILGVMAVLTSFVPSKFEQCDTRYVGKAALIVECMWIMENSK